MTEDRSPLAELMEKARDGDFLRSVAETVMQMMMEADVEGLVGARRHERRATRPITGEWRYLWLDATYFRQRERGRIVSVAGIIAVAVNTVGKALSYVPRGQQNMVAAGLPQAFIEPDRASASRTLRHVADRLRLRWPELAAFIDDSEADVLSYMDFSAQHRAKFHSTQSAGTIEQGGQAPYRRGRHLPQRGRDHPPDRSGTSGCCSTATGRSKQWLALSRLRSTPCQTRSRLRRSDP